MALFISCLIDTRMAVSTSDSQSSTSPSGYGPLVKGTYSFSGLIMPVIWVSAWNSSLTSASKHFLRCGWTARGSLVCERISMSSSLDRK